MANEMDKEVQDTLLTQSDEQFMDESAVAYRLLSVLLDYPDDTNFYTMLNELKVWLHQHDSFIPRIHSVFYRVIDQLLTIDAQELAAEYVQTFDFSETTSLYLTAHELGSGRGRGPALIELRNLFHHYGLEEASSELPDFLPALFELLSVLPPEARPSDIEQRLARGCLEIREHLHDSSNYQSVLDAALHMLPKIDPTAERFPLYEKADTDELPYPLMYD